MLQSRCIPQRKAGSSNADGVARVLLLMPTSTYHAHDFVEAAASLGIDVTVGTNGTQALQDIVPGSALTLDFGDLRASSDAIVDFAREFPIDGVVAAEDETTALAATCAAALGIAHNPIEAILTTQSKVSLRAALAAAGLPSPRLRRHRPCAAPGYLLSSASPASSSPPSWRQAAA